ncbi:MAG: cytochrome c3 family protein, partial [Planctomycetota bacterium]
CHDYETIVHGWHFNAFAREINAGRPSEPWVWSDSRTGTQLPLSYRGGVGTFDPDQLDLSPFVMTRHFGGRLPGGGLADPANRTGDDSNTDAKPDPRWQLTGALEIDCMICHAVSGAYDFESRRAQITDENFAWAPTAGLRLGTVDGRVSRIREGSDPDDEKVQAKLPTVTYDSRRFNADGTVFMDLVRMPTNNACYQCHSQRQLGSGGIEQRWVHDQDVHITAGMSCVDCHRNGIDHHIVRGYPNESHPSAVNVATLSCQGCHLGVEVEPQHSMIGDHSEVQPDVTLAALVTDELSRHLQPGRLGSPYPAHQGLPPIHFEKLSCTACHSGPIPGREAIGLMTSLSHGLGEKGHRTGHELPSIQGPIYAPAMTLPHPKNESSETQSGTTADHAVTQDTPSHQPVTPQRALWPAYWGTIVDGEVKPLPPEEIYTATRRALRVRKDFVDEVVLKDPDKPIFDEKVFAALDAIEKEMDIDTPVYVSTGQVFIRGDEEGVLTTASVSNTEAIGMVRWPIAHNVRPAGWSLGATGCLECHADDGLIFESTVVAKGPAQVESEPITMASLQGIDELSRSRWNQLFAGRKQFKILTASSLGVIVLAILFCIGLQTRRLTGSRLT